MSTSLSVNFQQEAKSRHKSFFLNSFNIFRKLVAYDCHILVQTLMLTRCFTSVMHMIKMVQNVNGCQGTWYCAHLIEKACKCLTKVSERS